MNDNNIEKTFTTDYARWSFFNFKKLHVEIKLKFSGEKIIYENIDNKETATFKIKDIVGIHKSEYQAEYGNAAVNKTGIWLKILFIIYAFIAGNYYQSTKYLLGGVIRNGSITEFTDFTAPLFFNPVISIALFVVLFIIVRIISKTSADKYVLLELKGASNYTKLYLNFKADRTDEISEISEFLNRNING